MSEVLLTNTVVTHAAMIRVQNILVHPENLSLWDNEIASVTATPTGFKITRQAPALNTTELLTISTAPNYISYHSHGGQLTYQLDFSLSSTKVFTTITETLHASLKNLPAPAKRLVPIAKQAFTPKLQSLVTLAESDAEVIR